MPTYDYECKECGHEFEYFQSMSAEPLRDCPECGGAVRRLIGGGMGIIFKGSGFYVTDNRGSNGNGGGEKKEAGESGSGSKKEAASAGDSSSGSGSDSGSEKSASGAASSKSVGTEN